MSISVHADPSRSGNFGPNNIPTCLKAITVLGMQQARHWNLGSINEFRKFFGLKPHDSFEDLCNEPPVAESLKNLSVFLSPAKG